VAAIPTDVRQYENAELPSVFLRRMYLYIPPAGFFRLREIGFLFIAIPERYGTSE